jgi:hypothetical protein
LRRRLRQIPSPSRLGLIGLLGLLGHQAFLLLSMVSHRKGIMPKPGQPLSPKFIDEAKQGGIDKAPWAVGFRATTTWDIGGWLSPTADVSGRRSTRIRHLFHHEDGGVVIGGRVVQTTSAAGYTKGCNAWGTIWAGEHPDRMGIIDVVNSI